MSQIQLNVVKVFKVKPNVSWTSWLYCRLERWMITCVVIIQRSLHTERCFFSSFCRPRPLSFLPECCCYPLLRVFFISVSIFSNQNVSSLTLLYQEHTHTHCHRFCLRNSPFANFTLSAAHISISVTQSSINPVLGSHTPLSTLHIQVPTRSSLPAAPPPRTVYTEHKRRRRHDMFCHELHSD